MHHLAWLSAGPRSNEQISASECFTWSLSDLRAAAALVHPSLSQNGAHYAQRSCPDVNTSALLVSWCHGFGWGSCTPGSRQLGRTHPAQAQSAEGKRSGRGREAVSGCRAAMEGLQCSQRAWQKLAALARGKGKSGKQSLVGIFWDADPQKLPLKRKETRMMVGRLWLRLCYTADIWIPPHQ